MGQVFAVFVVIVGVAEIVACIKHIQNGYLPTWAPRRVITDPKWRQKQLSCDIIKRSSWFGGGGGEDTALIEDNKDQHQLKSSQNNISGDSPSHVETFIQEAQRIINNNELTKIPDTIDVDDTRNKLGSTSNDVDSNNIGRQLINEEAITSINDSVNNNNNNMPSSKTSESFEEEILQSKIIESTNELPPQDENFNKTNFEIDNNIHELEENEIIVNNDSSNIKLTEHEMINEKEINNICKSEVTNEINTILLNENELSNNITTSALESDKNTSCITTNNELELHNEICTTNNNEEEVCLENKDILTVANKYQVPEIENNQLENIETLNKSKHEIFESVIDSLLNDSYPQPDVKNICEDVCKNESSLLDNLVASKVCLSDDSILVGNCETSKNNFSSVAEEDSYHLTVDPSSKNENVKLNGTNKSKNTELFEIDEKPYFDENVSNDIEEKESPVDDVDINCTLDEKTISSQEDIHQYNDNINTEGEEKINKSQLEAIPTNDMKYNEKDTAVTHIDVNSSGKVLSTELVNDNNNIRVDEKEEDESLIQQGKPLEQQVDDDEIPRESQITIPRDIESVSRKEKIINLLSGILTNAPVQENSNDINCNDDKSQYANQVQDIVEEVTESHEDITRTEISAEDLRKICISPNKLKKELLNEEIRFKINNGIKTSSNENVYDNKIEISGPDFETQVSVPFCDSPIIIPDESRLAIKDPPPFEPSTPPPSPAGEENTSEEQNNEAIIVNESKTQSEPSSPKPDTSLLQDKAKSLLSQPSTSTSNIESQTSSSGNKENSTTNENTQERVTIPTEMKNTLWLIFSGEYTKAMSKDWHSGHFCCWQCDESLTGQRYVLRDDHPYCIKCYESVFANTCEECNKTIGIDSKDLSYKDKHWHEVCFLCTKCRVSLVDKQFGSKADKIYCGNCYDSQFASRCDGCGEIFRAGTKKMEYKTRQWHEKCFCCCVCKTAIGTKSFIPREQEIYCAGCYEEKFATRCVKCNKIITTGGVTYKNEPWHRECFTCTNCNTSLAGQRFTSRDEKPYCAECFGELFAKRCTSCSKPITGIGGTRFISFEDRHWHNDCFICATCKTSLVGRGFITDADDIICPECAKQKLM